MKLKYNKVDKIQTKVIKMAYIILFINSLKQLFPDIYRIFLHRAEKGRFVGEFDQHQPFSTNGRLELRFKTWACADKAQ